MLDVATGTGLVAELLLARGHRVTGLDQSPDMLASARRRFGDRVALVEASATELPFPDASFDHLTFTYLLRYVDDPGGDAAPSSRASSARAARSPRSSSASRAGSGGRCGTSTSASGCRVAGRLVSPGWYEVGRFLGPSIRGFYERWPLERQLELWREAGIADVRARRLSLGEAW